MVRSMALNQKQTPGKILQQCGNSLQCVMSDLEQKVQGVAADGDCVSGDQIYGR